jgi:hypothetical protein
MAYQQTRLDVNPLMRMQFNRLPVVDQNRYLTQMPPDFPDGYTPDYLNPSSVQTALYVSANPMARTAGAYTGSLPSMVGDAMTQQMTSEANRGALNSLLGVQTSSTAIPSLKDVFHAAKSVIGLGEKKPRRARRRKSLRGGAEGDRPVWLPPPGFYYHAGNVLQYQEPDDEAVWPAEWPNPPANWRYPAPGEAIPWLHVPLIEDPHVVDVPDNDEETVYSSDAAETVDG